MRESEKICFRVAKLTRIEAISHGHVGPVILLRVQAINFGVGLDVGIEILANEKTVTSLLNVCQQRKQTSISDLPELGFFDGYQNPQQVATWRFPFGKTCVDPVYFMFVGAEHEDAGRTNSLTDQFVDTIVASQHDHSIHHHFDIGGTISL